MVSRQRKSWSRRKKIIVWSITSLLVLLALIAGFYAYRISQNTGGMFQGSMFDIFRNDQLKTDANGRSNILIFGTSEDDPGHSGAKLADSIMVLSIDPNKAVALTESLGDNVRTNVQTSELRTALDVAAGVRSGAMQSKVLNDPASPLVTTGSHQGQSIVRPIKGLTDYSDIHSFLWSDR